MSVLSLTLAGQLAGGQDVREVQRLDASKRGIAEVEDLSPCIELCRLDISHNCISIVGGIVFCKTLTWLDLSHNQLETLVGIQTLTNLVDLKALILSSNQLSVLTGLSTLKQLNTLVLSHNYFESISVKGLTQLAKLSLSHNTLRDVPDTQSSGVLNELRLNGNRISSIPETLGLNVQLTLLDLGNNRIHKLSAIRSLGRMRTLRNLNFRGNKMCDCEDYRQKVVETVSGVVVLDGRRQGGVPRRRKDFGVTSKEGGPQPADAQGGKPQREMISGKRKRKFREEHKSGKGCEGEDTQLEVDSSATAEVPSKKKKPITERGEGETQLSTKKRDHKTVKKSKTAAAGQDGRDGSDLTPEPKYPKLHRPRREHTDTENTQCGDPKSSPTSAVSLDMRSADPGELDKEERLSKERRKSREGSTKKKGGKHGQSGVLAVEDLRKAKKTRERPPSGDLLQSLGLGGDIGSGNSSSWT